MLRTKKELEALLAAQMKKVPQLKPYAKPPFTTYIILAALAAPFFTILPLLGLIGELLEI